MNPTVAATTDKPSVTRNPAAVAACVRGLPPARARPRHPPRRKRSYKRVSPRVVTPSPSQPNLGWVHAGAEHEPVDSRIVAEGQQMLDVLLAGFRPTRIGQGW